MNGYSSVIIYPNLNRKMCFFSLINLTMANNFLLVFFFHIEKADNDQLGEIGNGDEHANDEEGKNVVLLRVNHMQNIFTTPLGRVLCVIVSFPFFSILNSFYSFTSP